MDNPLNIYQASIKFDELFSKDTQSNLQNLIWKTPVSEREIIWNKNKLPFDEIEKAFANLTVQRNDHAQTKGFRSHMDFICNSKGISKKDYIHLIKKVDLVINNCNKILESQKPKNKDFYSEFGNHCFLCEIDNFPFHNLDEVAKSINLDQKSINIVNDDMSFVSSDNKNGEIHLDVSQNLRHKSLDLIHENFHLQINKTGKIINKYQSEKEVLVRELNFYKKHYPTIYAAFFGELLKVFNRVLFEIELYKNPNQDLAKLYACIFNKCYDGKYQSRNRSYLLDTLIIRYPFQNLPHMLAQIDVLTSLKL